MKALPVVLFMLAGAAPAEQPQAARPRFVKAWGKEGEADGEFRFPIGIALRGETLYVTDHYNNRVQEFDADGKHLVTIKVLPNPGGIAVDRDGSIFVSHFPASRMSKEETPDRISVL